MKKAVSLLLCVLLLTSLSTIAASASNELLTTTSSPRPDWIITEVCPDTSGNGIGGYTDGKDVFEFFEIYNNSGSTLNLYDYCMTYNGNARTSEKFETQIVEITPFKPGDYLDGSNLPWSGQANECSDLSNKPVNPDTCLVAPGEVVVIWSMYHEAYYASWNEGKGMSVADFRAFWNIPDDVKVIAWDACSSTSYGGHDKNFNIKNSDTGTYGIAYYSDVLNTAANTEAGGSNIYAVNYTESVELTAWVTLDFPNQLGSSQANMTYNFTIDNQGIGAEEWALNPDLRRMLLIEAQADPTPGTLTTLQKLTLGVPLDAGESLSVDDFLYYIPTLDTGFEGFEINGTLYPLKSTFTASSAGVYTLTYKYLEPGATTEPKQTDAPVTTPPKKDDTTTTPGDSSTTAPSTEATTTTTPPAKEKGCGSTIGFGLLACLIPAAVVIGKKKH